MVILFILALFGVLWLLLICCFFRFFKFLYDQYFYYAYTYWDFLFAKTKFLHRPQKGALKGLDEIFFGRMKILRRKTRIKARASMNRLRILPKFMWRRKGETGDWY